MLPMYIVAVKSLLIPFIVFAVPFHATPPSQQFLPFLRTCFDQHYLEMLVVRRVRCVTRGMYGTFTLLSDKENQELLAKTCSTVGSM